MHNAKHPLHPSDALLDGNLVTADHSAHWAEIQFDLILALLSRCIVPLEAALRRRRWPPNRASVLDGQNGMGTPKPLLHTEEDAQLNLIVSNLGQEYIPPLHYF